ncbi:unnamed protein product [Gadus morhua 'NCC']
MAKPEYPPYPLGMGYVLSLDLPGKLLQASAHIRPIYIEDVYLGMCLKHLGITPTNPPDESMFIINPVCIRCLDLQPWQLLGPLYNHRGLSTELFLCDELNETAEFVKPAPEPHIPTAKV